MRRAENFAIQLQQLTAFDQCDPGFVEAIALFSAKLTSSYSLTSRRFSVWAEVRSLLDEAFTRAVESYSGAWQHQLLGGMKLSGMGKTPPEWRADPVIIECLSGYDRTELRVSKKECLEVKTPDILEVDWQVSNLRLWYTNLRYVIRSAHNATSDPYEPACDRFCSTLDTAMRLLSVLAALRPGRAMYFGNWLSDDRTRPQGASYCELCWRATKRWSSLIGTENGPSKYLPEAKWRKLSNRYCEVHDPGEPKSRYHRDLPYKQAFRRELKALKGHALSGYSFRFPLPNGADTQELRKTAYDQVHSKLHAVATSKAASPGLREKVWVLHKKGFHKAEIARRLGISRQAVSKAWKALDDLVRRRQAGAYIDPATGESQVSDAVFNELKSLHAQGMPIADIAHRMGLLEREVAVLVRRGGDEAATNQLIQMLYGPP